MTSSVQALVQTVEGTRAAVPQLLELAARSLPQMFDHRKRLFCYRMRKTSHGLVREGVSPRYTLMTLLGLRRFEAVGGRSPIQVEAALDGLLSCSEWINNLGDLGLLLWACALIKPDSVEGVCDRLDVKEALGRFRDARLGKTMELAWFLTGLSHAVLNRGNQSTRLADLAVKTYRLLQSNHGDHGIFGHQTRGLGFRGSLRARIGAFADQVYPIYAYALYCEAFGIKEAVTSALRCAAAICRSQGILGQWWWHYDAVSGEVVGRYPVFSVHQDGMAPMALFALGQAAGTDFSSSIYKGLRWIYGDNELNCDFRELDANLIWRSIYARRHDRYWRPMATLLGLRETVRRPAELAVLFESRPYELGWLLYAFAFLGPGVVKGDHRAFGHSHS